MDSDELRFTQLFRVHYGTVYSYALRRADHAIAEEVASETLAIAWRRVHEMPADATSARPWLLAVARRVLANIDRSSRRAARLSARIETQPPTAAPDVADTIADRHRIFGALSHLSERDQEAMKLIGWDGLTVGEAAVVLGCSPGALKVRLHRARRQIHQALGESESPQTGPADAGLVKTREHEANA